MALEFSVTSLKREDFPSYSIVQAVLGDGATSEFVQDIMAGPCRVLNIDMSGVVAYLKMYDSKTPTIGTTDPDFVIEQLASAVSIPVPIPSGGMKFNVGLSFTAITVGGTAGVTGPVADITVTLTVLKGVS